jgi:hypothetical protein
MDRQPGGYSDIQTNTEMDRYIHIYIYEPIHLYIYMDG